MACTEGEANGTVARTCPANTNCIEHDDGLGFYCFPNNITCRAENGVILDACRNMNTACPAEGALPGLKVAPYCSLECSFEDNHGLNYDCPDDFDDSFNILEDNKCFWTTNNDGQGVLSLIHI